MGTQDGERRLRTHLKGTANPIVHEPQMGIVNPSQDSRTLYPNPVTMDRIQQQDLKALMGSSSMLVTYHGVLVSSNASFRVHLVPPPPLPNMLCLRHCGGERKAEGIARSSMKHLERHQSSKRIGRYLFGSDMHFLGENKV